MSKLNWMTKASGVLLLWATAVVALPAQTFTTLHNFEGTDGNDPLAGLTQATDGNFYGTTYSGGTSSSYCTQIAFDGCGTVFRITPSGTLTTLYSFCSIGDCTDGLHPITGLVQGTDGNLYGTTEGTVFKITLSGTMTTLHTFDGTDGRLPNGLILGTDGKFYGTTDDGGVAAHCREAWGCGTVFKITPGGALTTLYNFGSKADCSDGAFPSGALVQAANGDIYGTTAEGGTSDACRGGCGTVFRVTPSGTLNTLHSFEFTDGEYPTAGLVQATDGNFYGTTAEGGANNGCGYGDGTCGTAFKSTPTGTLTTLYNFDYTNGANALGGLIQATDGNFYGTTEDGGDEGTVFEITPGGVLTTLHDFFGPGGEFPIVGLVQATNGEFYGTTPLGGTGYGTVYSLNVGLGQFVKTLPTSGKVGAHVKILGSFLTGATSVTFNGTAATFTIISKSEITTTVPTGATTGTVQVISPRLGTLSSNVPFTVK